MEATTRREGWQRMGDSLSSLSSPSVSVHLPCGLWFCSLTRDVGMDAGEGRAPQTEGQSGTPTPGLSPPHPFEALAPWQGPPHQPRIAAGNSVLHMLVFAIKKFSGPSKCA